MRIHCLQHVPLEGPAGIADWAAEQGHSMAITPVFDNQAMFGILDRLPD